MLPAGQCHQPYLSFLCDLPPPLPAAASSSSLPPARACRSACTVIAGGAVEGEEEDEDEEEDDDDGVGCTAMAGEAGWLLVAGLAGLAAFACS
ncbi:MAG: hypothetical protein GY721_13860 [Deltaproteobacteria bacterium]|nr:hypothetical protein [Deltaproteobacteria bacterium]